MMVSLRRPSTETIREFLASQSKLGFTYTAVGATASLPPAGYTVDHTRIKLGQGEEVFTKAKAALGRWEQFRLGWMEAWSPETTIKTGDVVAVVARNLGLWWLNACRIVYVVDEPGADPALRVCLRHAARSRWRRVRRGSSSNGIVRAGEVWYDILAFSRPRHVLTRLGYPYIRRVQKRFGRESAAAMLKSVGDGARTGLMLKYGIIRSTMGEENSWLDLPVNADSASRSGRS